MMGLTLRGNQLASRAPLWSHSQWSQPVKIIPVIIIQLTHGRLPTILILAVCRVRVRYGDTVLANRKVSVAQR